ncbi:MAG: ABC transporter substrate-binding protein [Candidatus Poribacteria bacterium]|nr:ABC transporter substrate-binding protein [Candidatus Poribacteria bacterium]MDE0505842.1 ABC transporter substrate-binding protein [Candidatus Poribacteria bacterium]
MIVGSVLLLSSCDELVSVFSGGDIDAEPEAVSVGVVLPRTGYLGPGEFGPGALVMEDAFNLALEEANYSQSGGAKLKFIVEDDRSTTDGAVSAFNKLIHQDRVPVILGVWTSHVARTVFPIAQENGVVAFSPVTLAAGLTDVGDFVFRAGQPTDVLIPAGIKVTHEQLGYQRAAMISDSVDDFSRSSAEVIRNTLSDFGVDIVGAETFETGETSFSDQLTRIKDADPEAIFLSAQQIESIHILKEARKLGIPADVPFIGAILSADDIESAEGAAEGAITFAAWRTDADTPGNQEFVEKYRTRFGREPSIWAALSYAAVHILDEAIDNAETKDSVGIRDALANISNLDTILGQFSFSEVGDGAYDPTVLIVNDGKLEVFGEGGMEQAK